MSRYIDADAFLKSVKQKAYPQSGSVNENERKISLFGIMEILTAMPIADVVEHKRGEWIQHVNEPSLWSCSICETVIYSEHEKDRLKFHKWCGCCGADMRGEKNG